MPPWKDQLRGSRVIYLLALASCDNGGGLAEKIVVSGPSSSVEQIVFTDQEDTGQFLVVVGHHYVLRRTLAEVEQCVDILNTSESLLPKLKFNSDIQLLKTCLKMTLQSIGIVKVDGMHLSRVLRSSLDVIAK